MNTTTSRSVVVIGAGLSGLVASVLLARVGLKVTLLERAKQVAGRATTTIQDGFSLNLGPHALTKNGHAERVLSNLKVQYQAHLVAPSGSFALYNNEFHTLPSGPVSLLSTSLLDAREKWQIGKLLSRISAIKTEHLANTYYRDWLSANTTGASRGLLTAIARVATYCPDPEQLDAAQVLERLKETIVQGVLYVDDGWQSIANSLGKIATNLGVKIITEVSVTQVVYHENQNHVITKHGPVYKADAVLFCVGPNVVHAICPQACPETTLDSSKPITMATLDVGLKQLPNPANKFVMGIDQPLYASVHSATAKLAPQNHAVIHVAKYGDSDNHTLSELENILDRMQPGWQSLVMVRRYLPKLVVTHATPSLGRKWPSTIANQESQLYVAGDWVDGEGLLVDRAISSAEKAAANIISNLLDNRGPHAEPTYQRASGIAFA